MLPRQKYDLPILRYPDWPAFDRVAWDVACRPGGWFEPGGDLAHRSTTKIRVLESAYGRWHGYLSVGNPSLAIESGLDYFDQDRVQAFYERLTIALAPCTVRAYMTDLLTVARAMAPERSFDVLWAATRHIWRIAEPTADKYDRLVPARDLYALGFDLMNAAPSCSTALREAACYRDGLMIAFLIARPIRRGNLASIEIGRHLQKIGGTFWLSFPAAEVKNRRPLEYHLPAPLTARMDGYLSVYRPYLLARRGRHWKSDPGPALWISEHGTPICAGQIYERISRQTEERFGFRVNPHRFRDCAATSIAIEAPEHVGIVMPVLGHANARTGQHHYNQARSLEAARRYQATIDKVRNAS